MSQYAELQALRDREHEARLREWVASQPEDQQRELRKMGLDHVPKDFHLRDKSVEIEEVIRRQPDPHATMANEGEGDQINGREQTPAQVADPEERHWDYLRHAFGIVLAQPNCRLAAQCFLLASGMGDFIGNASAVSIAREHGITRAAVTKRMKQLTSQLGLKPSGTMRSLEVCDKYRRARHKAKWKPPGRGK